MEENIKKVYLMEYYDFDSITGEGDTTDTLGIYQNKEDAIKAMEKEYEKRKAAYKKEWIPQHEQLDIEKFEEEKVEEGEVMYYQYVQEDEWDATDGIGVRLTEFVLQ